MEAAVRGVVQGVGFRSFVLREAGGLGLSGFVANTRDGCVVVTAEGPRGRLEALAAALREGPSGSRVSDVALRWSDATGEFHGFEVRFI